MIFLRKIINRVYVGLIVGIVILLLYGRYAHGECYSRTGDNRIAACTRIIDLGLFTNKYLSDVHVNRGISYAMEKQYDLSLADYEKALELNSVNWYVHINRGMAYFKMERYEQAISDFSKVIELEPENAIGYKNRGNSYKILGQQDKAEIDFEQARQLSK